MTMTTSDPRELIINDIMEFLKGELNFINQEGINEVDVRLQLTPDGQYFYHTGDSQYDVDHRGYWGDGIIAVDDTTIELRELAVDMLDQIEDLKDETENPDDDNE